MAARPAGMSPVDISQACVWQSPALSMAQHHSANDANMYSRSHRGAIDHVGITTPFPSTATTAYERL